MLYLIWNIIGFIITFIVIIISYMKWKFQYWKNLNVPYMEPSIPYGTIQRLHNRTMTMGEEIKQFYDKMKERKLKFFGIYIITTPVLIITDLQLLKHVLIKDFHYFDDRGFYYNEKSDPISVHLFALGGKKWHKLRTKFTPTFTSSKMKQMFQTLLDCGDVLDCLMETKYHKTNKPIDIKEVLTCFTIDIIGSCAFGLECKTFEEENSPFRVYGKRMFHPSKFEAFRRDCILNLPTIATLFNARTVPKDISDFFIKVVTETVSNREKNQIERNDFLQLLINLKNNKNLEPEDYKQQQNGNDNTLTMNEIVAQCFIFFLGGFETSSTLMTFTLYELAKNPEIQEKVRKEIETVLAKHENKITYDSLSEMKYMSQVLDETLRKYTPALMTVRQCTKDYQLPDTDIIIKKGIKIFIPIYGIHMDPEYYPEPEKFNPERFSEENKQKRHQFTHLPFGEGPKNCIGMRFGLMQAKVGLTTLLRKYKFSVNSRTKEPLKMSPTSFVFAAEGDIWLNSIKFK